MLAAIRTLPNALLSSSAASGDAAAQSDRAAASSCGRQRQSDPSSRPEVRSLPTYTTYGAHLRQKCQKFSVALALEAARCSPCTSSQNMLAAIRTLPNALLSSSAASGDAAAQSDRAAASSCGRQRQNDPSSRSEIKETARARTSASGKLGEREG
ncbi:hypothetical protein JYU34_009317 [Plutella xylostella]|uniref:Uncharacterized protein n=1 Tax=Plutella xylostella TaxID=51655 RepID=A0ABQ7QJC7_PLUXY|nr:hypothetical protein JYU34_009317 [Plutella xylostella]